MTDDSMLLSISGHKHLPESFLAKQVLSSATQISTWMTPLTKKENL